MDGFDTANCVETDNDMWKRRRRHEQGDETAQDPGVVVRPDSDALTGDVAARLAAQVAAIGEGEVVIDVSDIVELDSAGVAALADLVEAPTGRVHIRGLPEATERMLGVGTVVEPPVEPGPDPHEELTRLQATAVYRPGSLQGLAHRLEALVEELPPEVEVAVVDLADVPALDAEAVDAVAFGSSSAALRGMRMLLVNVSPEDVETLRRAGLSEQTWVAPPPLQ